jgi:hypothetical protein
MNDKTKSELKFEWTISKILANVSVVILFRNNVKLTLGWGMTGQGRDKNPHHRTMGHTDHRRTNSQSKYALNIPFQSTFGVCRGKGEKLAEYTSGIRLHSQTHKFTKQTF